MANMRAKLNPNEVDEDDLFEGNRVVAVWDTFSVQIVFQDSFNVDTSANGGKNRFDVIVGGAGVTVAASFNSNASSF